MTQTLFHLQTIPEELEDTPKTPRKRSLERWELRKTATQDYWWRRKHCGQFFFFSYCRISVVEGMWALESVPGLQDDLGHYSEHSGALLGFLSGEMEPAICLPWSILWIYEILSIKYPAHIRHIADAPKTEAIILPEWRRKWQPAPVFLPGESHGQRSLASYSPWSRQELDPT